MKTYRIKKHVEHLAAYLMAYGWPFYFDSELIEFTASSAFVERMKREDHWLAEIEEFNNVKE